MVVVQLIVMENVGVLVKADATTIVQYHVIRHVRTLVGEMHVKGAALDKWNLFCISSFFGKWNLK